jgi:hypothetical protein
MRIAVSHVDHRAAEALRTPTRHLRRHLHAGVLHGIFPRHGVALLAPFVEVNVRGPGNTARQPASKLARAVSKSTAVPSRWAAGFNAWINPHPPFRLIGIKRATPTARDRADSDVAEIDVPAVLAFGIAAAGEDGHGSPQRFLQGDKASKHDGGYAYDGKRTVDVTHNGLNPPARAPS